MTQEAEPAPRSVAGKWITASVGRALIIFVALAFFLRVMGRIDWAEVWSSLTGLAAGELLVLAVLVVMRQILSATPLAVFVARLRLTQALQNDLSATVVATFAPPPSDILLRLAMLRSHRIDAAEGLSGITLNTLTFYVARFGAPVLGLGLAVGIGAAEPGYAVVAVVSGAIATVVVAGLVLATRGQEAAARVARRVGLALRRVSRRVDPAAWGEWTAGFVARAADQVRAGGIRAVMAQLGFVTVDSLIVSTAMRFAGVPAEVASTAAVLVAVLISYPLTALPFGGIGVLDAAIIGLLALDSGPYEAMAVAGLVTYRVCTTVVPLMGGVVTTVWWRASVRRQGIDALLSQA